MSDDHEDRDIEALLAAYRPAAPPLELREQVLAATTAVSPFRRPWLPIAAALLVAALLQWAAARIDTRIAHSVAPGADPGLAADTEAVLGVEVLPRAYLTSRLATPRRSPFDRRHIDESL